MSNAIEQKSGNPITERIEEWEKEVYRLKKTTIGHDARSGHNINNSSSDVPSVIEVLGSDYQFRTDVDHSPQDNKTST